MSQLDESVQVVVFHPGFFYFSVSYAKKTVEVGNEPLAAWRKRPETPPLGAGKPDPCGYQVIFFDDEDNGFLQVGEGL